MKKDFIGIGKGCQRVNPLIFVAKIVDTFLLSTVSTVSTLSTPSNGKPSVSESTVYPLD